MLRIVGCTGPLKPHIHRSYETFIVERTINRISHLLHVGLGDAGTQIIANNMKQGRMDVTVDGTRVRGAFGFCDIRQFTDATECLQVRQRLQMQRTCAVL